jgi:hypothetical protein
MAASKNTAVAEGAEAERQLQGFIDRFDPAIASLVGSCRVLLRARFPTALELVYDNYQALAIGYASSERASDCVVSLAVFPGKVSLSFYYGAAIPDPAGTLQGDGKQNRFVRLTSAEVLKEPAVETVIAAAEAHARLPMPADGGGTIIKSVSAKQRPRRP